MPATGTLYCPISPSKVKSMFLFSHVESFGLAISRVMLLLDSHRLFRHLLLCKCDGCCGFESLTSRGAIMLKRFERNSQCCDPDSRLAARGPPGEHRKNI